ncbi:MAG: Gx transporter family protein [Bacillota bacterium]
MSAKTVARFGMLTAVALVLGWVERFIPIGGIPGIKLGLANTVLLYAIYLMDAKSSWLLMFLKVALSGFLFASLPAMLYSFAGGLLSLIVMLQLHKAHGFSIVGVSVAGAVGHNIGQLLVACFMVTPRAALSYFPILLIAGVITGLLTGVAAKSAIHALQAGSKNTGTEEWKTDKNKT